MNNTGLLRRIGAMLYDGLLLFALLMLAAIPFIAARGGEAVPPSSDLFFRLTLLAVIFGFFVGFWSTSGRTLGMQSWRLQLETLDGQVPEGSRSVGFYSAHRSSTPSGPLRARRGSAVDTFSTNQVPMAYSCGAWSAVAREPLCAKQF